MKPRQYRIVVRGRISNGWADWFPGFTLERGAGTTALVGEVADQAKLRGLLTQIWNLNMELVSLQPETDPTRSDPG